jgi:mono/diheme cytochrome c family protein
MRRAPIALAALVALTGCGGGGRAPAARPHRGRAAALFVAAGCGDCHGLRAAGAAGGSGPDFDASEVLTRAQIRSGIFEGANGMPSYRGQLSPREVRELVDLIAGAMRGRR